MHSKVHSITNTYAHWGTKNEEEKIESESVMLNHKLCQPKNMKCMYNEQTLGSIIYLHPFQNRIMKTKIDNK